MAIDNHLSVKSTARLRCVSKTTEKYITPKKYSFYSIFKRLDLSPNSIIKMLFETDKEFINEVYYRYPFYPIKNHKYGYGIQQYITYTSDYMCIWDFYELISDFNHENYGFELLELAYDHCSHYTSYKPLRGLLTEMCVCEYTKCH